MLHIFTKKFFMLIFIFSKSTSASTDAAKYLNNHILKIQKGWQALQLQAVQMIVISLWFQKYFTNTNYWISIF